MILAVPMLIAIPEDVVPFAVVDPDTLVIHLLIVNWNLAVKILVEPMLNVNLKADLPSVNVPMDTVEILTPIVFVILAVQIPAVSLFENFDVKKTDMGPFLHFWDYNPIPIPTRKKESIPILHSYF